MGSELYALDFDGVLCDSCGESSLSALKAAKIRWPMLFEEVTPEIEEWIIDQMHVLRPVIETGYENLLLVRLLLEIRAPFVRQSSVADVLTTEAILEKWSELKPVIMKEWAEKSSDLINLFGNVRDDWIDKDLSGWIDASRNNFGRRHLVAECCCCCTLHIGGPVHKLFYPGIADALKFASSRIYIVTTKQSRFADALLRKLAGVIIPSEKIYGLGTGPKVEVLKKLQAMPEHQGLKLHFVEDRLITLKNVIKEPALDGWNLYLGKWGYNTEKEREEAESIPRIHLLDLSDFSSKLK